jgi:hypothetical protein
VEQYIISLLRERNDESAAIRGDSAWVTRDGGEQIEFVKEEE